MNVRMLKKIIIALCSVLCFAVSCGLPASSFASDTTDEYRGPSFQQLLEPRQTHLWIEGEIAGDFIIGSRGELELIYADAEFVKCVNSARSTIENWVYQMCQCWGMPGTDGRALFIAQVKAILLWDFNPENIKIGDYCVKKSDVVSPVMTNPFGELSAGEDGFFAFAVPKKEVKPGKTIEIAYGEYKKQWTVVK